MRHNSTYPVGRLILALVVLLLLGGQKILAQSSNTGNPLRQPQAEGDQLTTAQSRLADRYDQLELLAGRLAELSRSTQPRRARLLRELVAKSRERDIPGRFAAIVSALGNDSLGKASTDQVALQADLQKLLDLLLQEDRDRQIESERKRIRKYLAEVKRLIQLQRGIKARTDGGDEAEKLTKDQQRLAEATAKLEEQIKANELSKSTDENKNDGSQKTGEQGEPKEGKAAEKSSEEQKKSAEKPGAENPDDQKPGTEKSDSKKSSSKPQEGQPGADGKPSKSSPSQGDGQSQPSPAGESEPSEQSQSPAERAQQRLKKAQQRMQQALERLEEAKNEKAVEKQEAALRELEQAKAELERILRQLREEELERMLVLLEARFRKMLDAQVVVYEQTKKLDGSQSSVPRHEIEIASGRLDRQERQIVKEADRALVLLREDGTTVAFPEAVEQARDDMREVAKRLREVKIGVLTQGLEEDIITALEETLAALQQALKEVREKKSQPSSGSPGSPGEQPLVDQLAELRMIRALQNRVNRRTKRYGEILGDQPAIEAELLEALDELAERQERIFQATRDLDSGRNK